MFRQIEIHPDDQKYQVILWRFDTQDKVSFLFLQTVTYGMISTPFLAIWVTRQLAEDENLNFPLGAKILSEETYVDETLSGGDTLKEALKKQVDFININQVGIFSLHKWATNNSFLLDKIPDKLRIMFNE